MKFQNHAVIYKTPSVVPVYFSQLAIAIKDSVASPQTGWVFVGFAYDTKATGASVWDKSRCGGGDVG